jgi:alanyl-tRNA synthetase
MKIHELKKQLKLLEKEYPDLNKYDIFIEIVESNDLKFKKTLQSGWKFVTDKSDKCTHIELMGHLCLIPNKKILTININH